MAVTVDHISGRLLDFGLGAGWHEAEHRGYRIELLSAGT
jgi:alkanesulfonate monooxygenase SsuD/methylene tetrahydromethanopterin reductase-like flavin-dependent oxidoreductase (luciferase family)